MDRGVMMRELVITAILFATVASGWAAAHEYHTFDRCIAKKRVDGCSIPFNTSFPYRAVFKPACNRHDVCYRCGKKFGWSRKECDTGFLYDLYRECEAQNIIRRRKQQKKEKSKGNRNGAVIRRSKRSHSSNQMAEIWRKSEEPWETFQKIQSSNIKGHQRSYKGHLMQNKGQSRSSEGKLGSNKGQLRSNKGHLSPTKVLLRLSKGQSIERVHKRSRREKDLVEDIAKEVEIKKVKKKKCKRTKSKNEIQPNNSKNKFQRDESDLVHHDRKFDRRNHKHNHNHHENNNHSVNRHNHKIVNHNDKGSVHHDHHDMIHLHHNHSKIDHHNHKVVYHNHNRSVKQNHNHILIRLNHTHSDVNHHNQVDHNHKKQNGRNHTGSVHDKHNHTEFDHSNHNYDHSHKANQTMKTTRHRNPSPEPLSSHYNASSENCNISKTEHLGNENAGNGNDSRDGDKIEFEQSELDNDMTSRHEKILKILKWLDELLKSEKEMYGHGRRHKGKSVAGPHTNNSHKEKARRHGRPKKVINYQEKNGEKKTIEENKQKEEGKEEQDKKTAKTPWDKTWDEDDLDDKKKKEISDEYVIKPKSKISKKEKEKRVLNHCKLTAHLYFLAVRGFGQKYYREESAGWCDNSCVEQHGIPHIKKYHRFRKMM